MTKQEFADLKPGDLVKFGDHECIYMVSEYYGPRQLDSLEGWRLQVMICNCHVLGHDTLVTSGQSDWLFIERKSSHED